jgi:hypothetical protein
MLLNSMGKSKKNMLPLRHHNPIQFYLSFFNTFRLNSFGVLLSNVRKCRMDDLIQEKLL